MLPECDADVEPSVYLNWRRSLTTSDVCMINEAFRQVRDNIDILIDVTRHTGPEAPLGS